MALRIAPLFSGSSGNSILIRSEQATLLIDAGTSCSRIRSELAKAEECIDSLDGILVTHEHTDHISGLDIITKKYTPMRSHGKSCCQSFRTYCPGTSGKSQRRIFTSKTSAYSLLRSPTTPPAHTGTRCIPKAKKWRW